MMTLCHMFWRLQLILLISCVANVLRCYGKSIPTQNSLTATTFTFPLIPQALGFGLGPSFTSELSSAFDRWQHVNKSCLSPSHQCDESVNLKQLLDLEQNMRTTTHIDPCENFYEYACGNWQQSHPGVATMMDFAANKITESFVDLFEQQLQRPADSHSDLWSKMLEYYKSCLTINQPVTLKRYFVEMQRLNFRLFDRTFNWIQSIGELSRYGYASHFLQVTVRHLNATNSILNIDPHNDDTKVDMKADIYNLLQKYSKLTFDELVNEFNAMENILQDFVNEVLGATTSVDYEDIYENHTQIYTIKELIVNFPEIDWHLLLSSRVGKRLDDMQEVSVVGIEALQKIACYLNKGENVEVAFLYTLARFLNHLERLPHTLIGINPISSKNCIRHMRKTLYLPMTYLIDKALYETRRYESDMVIREVFEKLKNQFAIQLNENHMRLQPEDLEHLKLKLFKLRLNIGNVPSNMSIELLENHMIDFKVTDDFYANHLRALKHSYSYQHYLLQNHLSEIPWRSFNYHMPDMPDNVDGTPYFYCLNNMIIIPHAYLKRPFFDKSFWPALLYGDLANTLGHELIHAFDTNFLQYDAWGNYKRSFLRHIETHSELSSRLNCLGNDTEFLTERIADLSGSRLALNTFMNDAEFRKLNGKIYFLQFAQFFCGDSDDRSFHEEDPDHDPGSQRLIYTLRQMPEFGELFNCPAASGMVLQPENRCELW